VALIKEAQSWRRTPFRPHCQIKGVGCDCVGFPHALLQSLGAIQPITFPSYALDEGSHSNESKLERVLVEAGCFKDVWHCSYRPSPISHLPSSLPDLPPLMHGDLLGFHLGRSVHHIGVLLVAPHFIHSLQNYGVVESTLHDPTYRRVLVSVWRCMEPIGERSPEELTE
jgi:cell wall-associated NlpC family hydrolase